MTNSSDYSLQLGEEDVYAAAMSEVNSDARRPGVWAKALADSDGDESKCKALYIRLRVQQEKDRILKEIENIRAKKEAFAKRRIDEFATLVNVLKTRDFDYIISMEGSGWVVRDPLCQRQRFASVDDVIRYLQSEKKVAHLVADFPLAPTSQPEALQPSVDEKELVPPAWISNQPASPIDFAASTPNSGTTSFPTGVGGWLLLLVIGMMGLGQLIRAVFLFGGFGVSELRNPSLANVDKWESYKTVMVSTFLIFAAIQFYGGFVLATKRERLVVNRVKFILWLIGPGYVLMLQVLVPIIVLGEFNGMVGQTIGSILGASLGAFAWSSYLAKSKRVQNTYAN